MLTVEAAINRAATPCAVLSFTPSNVAPSASAPISAHAAATPSATPPTDAAHRFGRSAEAGLEARAHADSGACGDAEDDEDTVSSDVAFEEEAYDVDGACSEGLPVKVAGDTAEAAREEASQQSVAISSAVAQGMYDADTSVGRGPIPPAPNTRTDVTVAIVAAITIAAEHDTADLGMLLGRLVVAASNASAHRKANCTTACSPQTYHGSPPATSSAHASSQSASSYYLGPFSSPLLMIIL